MRRTLAAAAGLMLTAALATRRLGCRCGGYGGARQPYVDVRHPAGQHPGWGALHGPSPTELADEAGCEVVRTSTWQGFETLNANRCGQYGSLLLGIDKDTKSGHLDAVGHANGTATVIKGLGKVPATFGDAVNYRWSSYYDDPLFGE